MTQPTEMPPTRRRPIPGMTPIGAPADRPERDEPAMAAGAARPDRPPRTAGKGGSRSAPDESVGGDARSRRPADDYATTRLVNFRLPADLHDRFKQLVRDAEERHPRLRRPSFTELVIALLEEGPATPDEVAELIRRKRAGEHEAQP